MWSLEHGCAGLYRVFVAVGLDVLFVDPVNPGQLSGQAPPPAGTPPGLPFYTLHCIDDNDRGGNEVQVRYPGRLRKTDLHEVWDSHILQDAMGDRELGDYADALDVTITQADIQVWLSSSSPASWANEVHKTAQGLYRELPAARFRGLRTLPKGYGSAHKGVVERQLKQGGIRLAQAGKSAK